jgi:hypothetical protein
MNPIVRNSLAAVAGVIVGSVVNLSLLAVGAQAIPPPAGADVSDMEKLRAAMPLFEAKHFLFPFLAHALGAFVGSLAAALLAATHRAKFAWGVAGFFLLGGIANAFLLPAPAWFIALDLVAAYLPMGWLAARAAGKLRPAI